MKFHFSIPIKDLAKSKAFYEGLGFVEINSWVKPDKGYEAVILEHDNTGCILEIVACPAHQSMNLGEIPIHVGLAVGNLEELLEKLAKEGVEIAKSITPGASVKCYAFIKDPDGFAIELYENK